jgi:hypothetical protein
MIISYGLLNCLKPIDLFFREVNETLLLARENESRN